MSKQDVKNFFEKYVFGWRYSDIQREIDLARLGEGTGNYFVVEIYFEDFSNACKQHYMQKMTSQNPELPKW